MSDRRLVRLHRDVVELLDRAGMVLEARLADIHAARVGFPQSAGQGGGARSVMWCDEHQRDVAGCQRAGELCDGVPVTVSGDPTGEAALRPDRAASDRARLEEAYRALARQAETVVAILAAYTPRAATDAERRATLASNDREDTCWSCERTEVSRGVTRFEPAWKRSVVDGELRWLCRWCYDWRRSTGGLPSPQQVDDHHRGKRVRRSA